MIEKNTRKLFQAWLRSAEGGGHTEGAARSYCSYANGYTGALSVFSNASAEELNDISALRVEVDQSIDNSSRRIRTGLSAFRRFLRWIAEHPWCQSYGALLSLLERQEQQEVGVVRGRQNPVQDVDAYGEFFSYFEVRQLTPRNFYQFGLEKSVYADDVDEDAAVRQFQMLISLLENGTATEQDLAGRRRTCLSIRRYSGSEEKSRWFIRLYERVFRNARVRVEKGGNMSPKLNICGVTRTQLFTNGRGFRISHGTQRILKNFQCSHVFDSRTQNPLLFEAVWNIVLTPKLIDPLTGHETLGRWPGDFQPMFRNLIRRKFVRCIELFNETVQRYGNCIEQSAREVVEEFRMGNEEAESFVRNAIAQWRAIDLAQEPESI